MRHVQTDLSIACLPGTNTEVKLREMQQKSVRDVATCLRYMDSFSLVDQTENATMVSWRVFAQRRGCLYCEQQLRYEICYSTQILFQ